MLKKGFTILELLIVLVIISMVIGMSIPAFSSYVRGSRVRTAASEISSTIMLARTQAITLREERVVFFLGAGGVVGDFGIIGGEQGHFLPPGIRFNDTGANFPGEGVKLTPAGRVDGNPPYVIIIFSDRNNNNIMDGDESRRTITVGALGHVTIE